MTGLGEDRRKFTLVDPTAFSEDEFELHVRNALNSVYSEYYCIPFKAEFEFVDGVKIADLALIHKQFTHWFILEVELLSHSLHGHVLPQVRCFQYGKPRNSCISAMLTSLPGMERNQVITLLHLVPRSVAVIVNIADAGWVSALRAVEVQCLAVSLFKAEDGTYALETDGTLNVPLRSLGFFPYSAVNRSLRLTYPCDLAEGELLIQSPNGTEGTWTVRCGDEEVWVTKTIGDPGILDESVLQVIRTTTGKIVLRSFPKIGEKPEDTIDAKRERRSASGSSAHRRIKSSSSGLEVNQ